MYSKMYWPPQPYSDIRHNRCDYCGEPLIGDYVQPICRCLWDRVY